MSNTRVERSLQGLDRGARWPTRFSAIVEAALFSMEQSFPPAYISRQDIEYFDHN